MSSSKVSVITTDLSAFDPVAMAQLERVAAHSAIEKVVGLPDLHAGRGVAVGAAYWSSTHIFPELVGSDIGCGMALWKTATPVRKFKLDASERKLQGLDGPWDGDVAAELNGFGLAPSLASAALGTIGGGNHFAELLRVETIIDQKRFDHISVNLSAATPFGADMIWLMVHSGSRGLGQAILDRQLATGGVDGWSAQSAQGIAYLADHDEAVRWAECNRFTIAQRFFDKLGMKGERLLDICHNEVTPHQKGWLHRKGAAPADRGPVIIPGSRGDYSYLVEPIADNASKALFSLAHGAGRRWSRSDAHAKLSKRYRLHELQRTKLGGRVICEDRRLIFEEAPEAYKPISRVIDDLLDAGLIRVIASFRPLLSYKVRRA